MPSHRGKGKGRRSDNLQKKVTKLFMVWKMAGNARRSRLFWYRGGEKPGAHTMDKKKLKGRTVAAWKKRLHNQAENGVQEE